MTTSTAILPKCLTNASLPCALSLTICGGNLSLSIASLVVTASTKSSTTEQIFLIAQSILHSGWAFAECCTLESLRSFREKTISSLGCCIRLPVLPENTPMPRKCAPFVILQVALRLLGLALPITGLFFTNKDHIPVYTVLSFGAGTTLLTALSQSVTQTFLSVWWKVFPRNHEEMSARGK